MRRDLELTLAYHCAPALLGRKAANLVALTWAEFPDLEERTAEHAAALGPGVSFRLLDGGEGRALLLVYRRELLERQLRCPLAERLLRRDGYDPAAGVEAMLDRLGRRLGAGGEFPHEIGLFLGYPPEDVEGFQIHRGRDCKLCGCWKVYSDVERARALFQLYDRCRERLCARLAGGATLREALRAA